MNILTRLKNETDLTEAEQALAGVILASPDLFLAQNGKQLAARAAVSQATVYRLCEKLGCSGLADLKVQVSGALEGFRNEKGSVDVNFPVLPSQEPPEVMANLAEDYRQTIAATRNALDPTELKHAAELVAGAKRVTLYASAGNAGFAQNFKFQMAEMGKDIRVPIDEYEQRLAATSSGPDDVAIVVSFGGRGLLAVPVAKELKRCGATVVAVCSAAPTPLDVYADCRLAMAPYENHYRKVSSFATRLSLLYVLDVLYACCFMPDYKANIEHKLGYYDGIVRQGKDAQKMTHPNG